MKKLVNLGAHVELVETVFEQNPRDLWTAEFYVRVGIKLRALLQERRDELDPGVADILKPALSQDMQNYYAKVVER